MSKLMLGGRIVLVTGLGLVTCATAWSEGTVQTLDRVQVNSVDSVLEMNFDDPRRTADFENTGIVGSDFRACELTALDGLYCLDGRYVRNWPDQDTPANFSTIVDCRDPVLDLDNRKGDACSAMTVDSSGAVWIAGKTRRSYSLFRVVRAAAAGCPAGLDALALTDGCAAEVAAGTGRIDDLTSIDGTVAAGFGPGKGVLALEDGNAAVHYGSAGGARTVLATGKRTWDLQGNEQLLGIALLQLGAAADEVRNVLVATTSAGRVLTRDESSQTASEAFDIHAERETTSVQCDFQGAAFGVRASSSSGLVYVTDRQYCEVLALRAVTDASGDLSHLVNAVEGVFDQSGNPTGLQRNLTLSTVAGSASHPPEGPTLAPGISIDLDDCSGSCPLVIGGDGAPAASLSNVRLASQQSGLTLFQIRNIPDCRYIPQICEAQLDSPDLVDDGVIVNLAGNANGNPAGQLLNLTPLLPLEIRDLFEGDGGSQALPPMYMSRLYRGQKDNGFVLDAFFGITEEGVTFEGVFNGEFDVEALTGSELGCELGLPAGTPVEDVLRWDTVTTASERYVGIDGRHVDTLINTDCGSSRTLQKRWSIVAYNTEVAPCTYNGDPNDVWVSDGSCPVGGNEHPDDAVFAKLLLSLYDELGATLDQLACADVDGGGSAPLSASSCATLDATWANGKDKLDKCWNATQQPKQSAGDQTCQAFLSQLTGFSNTLAGVPAHGPDPANRKGELRARVEVLFHLYHERFVPSLSSAGFCEPGNAGC